MASAWRGRAEPHSVPPLWRVPSCAVALHETAPTTEAGRSRVGAGVRRPTSGDGEEPDAQLRSRSDLRLTAAARTAGVTVVHGVAVGALQETVSMPYRGRPGPPWWHPAQQVCDAGRVGLHVVVPSYVRTNVLRSKW